MSIFDYPHRMISGTKRGPEGHVCVWNANVCIKSRGKIWFGDLDLMADLDEIKTYAAKMGEPLYILREHDARFDNEANPLYDEAVAVVQPDGEVTIADRWKRA
jgi:hypothetical protein